MNEAIERIKPEEIEKMFVWDIVKYAFEKYKAYTSKFHIYYKKDEILLTLTFKVPE